MSTCNHYARPSGPVNINGPCLNCEEPMSHHQVALQHEVLSGCAVRAQIQLEGVFLDQWPGLTEADKTLVEIRERDRLTAQTWFEGPANDVAQARRDRRTLLAMIDRLWSPRS